MDAREIPLFVVDAFTDRNFQGNPAPVFVLDQDLPDDVFQKMASEMNQADSAFIQKLNPRDSFEKSSTFSIRWFTPTVEVKLCGHATVGAAKVLFDCYGNTNDKLSFKSSLGMVHASRGENGVIVLDFPLQEPEKIEDIHEEKIAKFLKVASCGYDVLDVQFSPPTKKLLVRLDEENLNRSRFESLSPDTTLLRSLLPDIRGLILTVKANGALDQRGRLYHFLSRFFDPWEGVAEDPVCGSAHAVLTPYWGRVFGKTVMYARQCSKRGGDLSLELKGNGRVNIGGNARVILRGTITI